MRITDVEAIVLRQPELDDSIADGSQDNLVIRITTDAGIVGIAEVDSSPEIVKAAIEAPSSWSHAIALRELLVGQDPLDVDGLWRRLYEGAIYYARRGVGMHALSGIEIALWDIKGKAADKPVCELLGERRRERVRAYASTLMPDTPEETEARVRGLVTAGFTAVKLGWGPLGGDAELDIELGRAARRGAANGKAVDLIIDAGLGYGADADTAIRVAREYEAIGVYCLEEPFGPDQLEAYAKLADAVDLPISQGEQLSTRWEFRDVLERGRVDVVQPDVTRCGGLREALRIDELARERGRLSIPHAWKSGIIKAASLHVLAVVPDAPFLEYAVGDAPINQTLTNERFPLDADGFVAIPTAPGLGVTLNEAVLEEFRVHSPRRNHALH